jgi:hypothetical protein
MPMFEGSVLRVYRLPLIVEAADREEARREIEKIYLAMQADYDGAQDVFCDDVELPASQWPVKEVDEELTGAIQWTPTGPFESSGQWLVATRPPCRRPLDVKSNP